MTAGLLRISATASMGIHCNLEFAPQHHELRTCRAGFQPAGTRGVFASRDMGEKMPDPQDSRGVLVTAFVGPHLVALIEIKK